MPREAVEAPVIVGEPVDGWAACRADGLDRIGVDLVLEEDEEGEIGLRLTGHRQ
jgi:hypothetical protein